MGALERDDLHARLARLRREDHGERPAESGAPASEIAARLARRAKTREPARAGGAIAVPIRLFEVENERGSCAARIEEFALEHRHGALPLGALTAARESTLALVAKDEGLVGFRSQEACFLDIETTGLSGGAGCVPFLVAIGRFHAQGFELWQGLARSHREEPALLEEVSRCLTRTRTLVTFFGKSFDRHRLEDKMRVHAVASPFAPLVHLDLFHPLRRLYKRSFPDTRLSTMERRLVGVERMEDLPGSFAPEAWFDFVAGRAHRLEDVFRHNRDDVLSLVVLAAHLGRVEEACVGPGPELGAAVLAERSMALARICAEARRPAEALAWIEHSEALGLLLDPDMRAWRERLLRRAIKGIHARASPA